MKRRTELVIAAIFLVVAVVLPLYVIYQTIEDNLKLSVILTNYIHNQVMDETAIQAIVLEATLKQQTLFISAAIISAICLAVFFAILLHIMTSSTHWATEIPKNGADSASSP